MSNDILDFNELAKIARENRLARFRKAVEANPDLVQKVFSWVREVAERGDREATIDVEDNDFREGMIVLLCEQGAAVSRESSTGIKISFA